MMNCALIALGSNQPHGGLSPADVVTAAIRLVNQGPDTVVAASQILATPAFPEGSGPDFANAAIRVETHRTSRQILDLCHMIEQRFARSRDKRWSARTLDLDLIAHGDTVLPDVETLTRWMDLPLDLQKKSTPDRLILPHPRLQDRGFVLRPLNEVAPEWRHPVLKLSVSQMLAARPTDELAAIIPIAPPPAL